MKRSHDRDALIDALFEGRATPEETARLLGDAGEVELEELAEIVETLSRIDPGTRGPSTEEFAAARGAVLRRIAPSATGSTAPWSRWLPLAAALLAFVVGLGVGRSREATANPPSLTELADRGALETAAGQDGPFRYSNLRLRELDDGSLALTVDVAAELDLVRPKGDLLVEDILASALVNDASLGSRLKAVRYAAGGPAVHRALIEAVLGDPDMSVRLKALGRLIALAPAADDTQQTLLRVVRDEDSVAMRLIALDALRDDYLDPSLLETLSRDGADGGDPAVLWSARHRLERRRL